MLDLSSIYNKRIKSHHLMSDFSKFKEKYCNLSEILEEKSQSDLNTIYIHIPFCSKICSFCNMSRFNGAADNEFVDMLIENIKLLGNSNISKTQSINSIYFGGGTPTTLNEYQFERIFEAIYRFFKITYDAEISVETSLSDLSTNKLNTLIKLGVNRISIGVQTFNDSGRTYFKRLGNGYYAIEKIKEYKNTGLKNINADLIYCYPNSCYEDTLKDIRILDELGIGGFSIYSLITSKRGLAEKDFFSLEEEYEIFYKSYNLSKMLGYEFFELTKMIKPGYDNYQYIVNSHNNKNIFPIGPGAGGKLNNTKFRNPLNLDSYLEFLNNYDNFDINVYSKDLFNIIKEANKVQFGIISKDFKNNSNELSSFINQLSYKKLITDEKNHYKLTDIGIFFGNNIYSEYFKLLSDSIDLEGI